MITIPVFIIIFLIFVVWTQYEMRKSSKKNKQAEDEFWARENEANNTRKKDISDLPLFKPDTDMLPKPDVFAGDACDASDEDGDSGVSDTLSEINDYINRILTAAKEPMLDLSGYSNTDLKLNYGTGNFAILSGYDENFHNYLVLITGLARAYQRAGMNEKAVDSYKFAIAQGSIKLTDYTGMAESYLAMDAPEKIDDMINEITLSDDIPHKDGIIDGLKRVLAKY